MMKIESFIDNFASQFDETDRDVFNAETKFHELEEWSSLIMLSVQAMIDEEYEVVVKGEKINNAETIEDLFNIVKALKEM